MIGFFLVFETTDNVREATDKVAEREGERQQAAYDIRASEKVVVGRRIGKERWQS